MTTRAHRPARRAAVGAALLLSAGCASGRPAAVPAPAPERDGVWSEPAAEPAPDSPGRDILGSAVYDLPVEANTWVEAELDFLVGGRREVIARWLERGDFYEPYVKEVLRAHEIPTDLYHLAMIESGFVPTARSHAGAVGMWQFMPVTGRAMGLRVDSEVDERMDPVRSTRAAARHLRSLHRSLGDWALAAAAYNAGSGRITRGLAAFGASNFWELAHRGDLAEETRRYVPRLFAVTVIGRDRSRFGFPPPDVAEQFAYDSVNVEYATPLTELARLGGIAEDRLRRLNPHLLTGTTPAGGYWVWVPAGEGAELQRAWLASDFRRDRGRGTYTVQRGDDLGMPAGESQVRPPSGGTVAPSDRVVPGRTHRVQPGETLWSISRAYGVTVASIEEANGLDGTTIRPGQSLSIPAPAATSAARPPLERSHVVEAGETLWSIARRYGSSVERIREVNSLGARPIQPGQRLAIPAPEGGGP